MAVEGVPFLSPYDVVKYVRAILYCYDNDVFIGTWHKEYARYGEHVGFAQYLKMAEDSAARCIEIHEGRPESITGSFRENHVYNLEYSPGFDTFNIFESTRHSFRDITSTEQFSNLTEELMFQYSTCGGAYEYLLELYYEFREQNVQRSIKIYMTNIISFVFLYKELLDSVLLQMEKEQ